MSKEIAMKEVKSIPTALQSVDDVVRMGKVFFESGMFQDVKSTAQAIIKIQCGAELGIPPFQAMSGIHVIHGKPTIGAGLMASKVDQHPEYDYEVIEQTDKACEIKFFKNGKMRGASRFTVEDAKKAGTQNMGKYPANMLFARAMSNGVKWYCPGVFTGPVYVPEEMEMATEDTQDVEHTEVKITLEEAIADVYACESLECLKTTWTKYKQFQKQKAFIKAKDDRKTSLTQPEVVEDETNSNSPTA